VLSNWSIPLQHFARAAHATAYDLLLLPGNYVLSIVARTPHAAILSDGDALLLRSIVAALFWLLVVVLIWQLVRFIMRLIKSIARVLLALWLTAKFRFEQGLRNFRTRFICAIRQLVAGRRFQRIEGASEVEFDDIDVAVMRNGAGLLPGYTLSVPELAGRLTVRPSLVQNSLDKLRKLKLVERSFGSTDGFENYRLTGHGVTLLTAWRRNGS
jgi:hypothetical protein